MYENVQYVITISQPRETLRINLAQQHLYDFELVEYYAEGLVNQRPLYVKFLNQPMNAIFGNLPASSLTLLFDKFPNTAVILSNALPVTMNMNFNDSHQLQVSVENENQSPATFSRLILIFKAKMESPSRSWTMNNLEKSLRQA